MIFRSELIETIAESLPILVADLDTGVIVWASKPLEAVFGYFVHGELTGKIVEDLVPRTKRAVHVEHRRGFAADPKARPMGGGMILEGVHKDGHTFPVEIGLSAAVISGQRCVIAVVLVMTERHAAQHKAETNKV